MLFMMKKIYLVHGWKSNSDSFWFPWLANELGKKGHEVFSIDFVESDSSRIEDWVKKIKESVDCLDEKVFFVAHSVGCQAVLRFLEKAHKHVRIGGCVFVAPWLDLINLDDVEMRIAHNWINSEINFERIKDHVGEIFCIFSDNDIHVSEKEVEKFKEFLGAEILIKKGRGHFSDDKKIEEVLKFLSKK